MNYYSFEKLKLDYTGHYDLFEKTIVNDPTLPYSVFPVTDEFNGRLDLLCRYLNGNTNYLEEMMVINNIFNPYSIKSGTLIKYFKNPSDYGMLYQSDKSSNDIKDEILSMNKSKQNKKDNNRIGSPPTIKPDNLKQLDINYSKRKITVMNKFK